MKIKIAMIGWEYPPHIVGGLGKHCYNLVNELLKLGHEIYFFSPSFFGEKSYDDGNFHMIKINGVTNGRIYSHYSTSENVDGYAKKVYDYLKLIKPDIVHGHDWISVKALNMAKSAGMKTLLTIHSLDYMRSRMKTKLYDIERDGCRNHHLITVSNWMKGDIERRFGVDNSDIHVVYNGVEAPMESEKKDCGNMVFYIGRYTFQKGVEYIIYAAKILKRHDVSFVFAGSGSDELEQLSDDIGVNAKFLGFVDDRQKYSLYRSAKLFVSPSIYEPFGITIGEALSVGTPVVATDSGITEILEEGKDYLRFEKRDSSDLSEKINLLLNDEKYARELGKSGMKKVSKLTWKKAAVETSNIYESLF